MRLYGQDYMPDGDFWLHEIKFDGYRMLAQLDRSRVSILTGRGNDRTDKYPSIARFAHRAADAESLPRWRVVRRAVRWSDRVQPHSEHPATKS